MPGQLQRASLDPVGAQPAPLTTQEHLAITPLPLEVRRSVKQVMPQEQSSKRHRTVNIQDEIHRYTSHSPPRRTSPVSPLAKHLYGNHGNYVPTTRPRFPSVSSGTGGGKRQTGSFVRIYAASLVEAPCD